ncbi:hypothetical protein [Lactobacillus delbrueckii]|uniref:hypothetical protein n=1 Tax=Lactobacillus delbrueckii TaxID=1584 RepID=UPI001E637A06|nr:hypothetical protein [Lactobacillus delbrueckii]
MVLVWVENIFKADDGDEVEHRQGHPSHVVFFGGFFNHSVNRAPYWSNCLKRQFAWTGAYFGALKSWSLHRLQSKKCRFHFFQFDKNSFNR